MPDIKSEKMVSDGQMLRYFWRAGLPYKRKMLSSSLVPVGALGLSVLVPYFTGKLLAELSVNPHGATHYLPYLIAAGIGGALANRFGTVALFRWQAQVIYDLQTLCLNNLLQQGTGFHNNRVAGKLVSDAIDFPQTYMLLSNSLLLNIAPLAVTIVTGVALVSARSWQLGLVLLGMATVVIGATWLQSRSRRPLRMRRLVAGKAVTSHLADTIVNNQTVKTFGHEAYELKKHEKLNKTLLDIRISDWSSGARAGNNRILGLLAFQLLFAFVIIHLVEQNRALLAVGIFAFSYSIALSNNLFSINTWIRQIEDALLQAEPMMSVLNHRPSVQDKPNAPKLTVTSGGILFEKVDFSYQDSSSQDSVFENLNIDISPGEKVGLVGPSGGGKSTLTRLLLRFNDIQGGSIAIDGQNIAEVTQNSLRQAIAYVPQEPLMFHRSVLDNIAYGNLGATKEQVFMAAQQAHAHEFISALPDGYDTLVGERGVKLSGGQRQRVAIARAILKDAPILVLDEATSALDSESERLIQDALQELMQGRTAIVIAHRLSTIQKMDRIIVMENGHATEQGTHQQLIKQKGTYARLWAHQSGGFIED